MFHLIYIFAFTVIAILAMVNLVRSLLTLGLESQRSGPPPHQWSSHPEMLDGTGHPINEPLLVLHSMSVEDVRAQLDALYKSSPGYDGEARE